MSPALKNPYLPIFLTPLVIFLSLILIQFPPDPINLGARLGVFFALGYIGARYVWRAPQLVWVGAFKPHERNIVGWAVVIVALMGTQCYSWLYISYDRPFFLSSSYWSPAFVVLTAVGLGLVASSVPKLPPLGKDATGLSVAASIFFAVSSAITLAIAAHLPQVIAMLKSLFFGVLTAV